MAVRTYGEIIYSKTTEKETNLSVHETIAKRRHKNLWTIKTAEPHICLKLKQLFPKIGETSTLPFHFYDTPETCTDLLWFMDRFPMQMSDADLKRMKSGKKIHVDQINKLFQITLPSYVPRETVIKLNEGKEGRKYQLSGKDLAMEIPGLLIADDLGLGKTLTAILCMLEEGMLPCAVVVQTHLTNQWYDEIKKFTCLKVHIIKGTRPYSLPPADVYIFKYSNIAGWVDIFREGFLQYAIFDEAQELRRQGSNKYDAAEILRDSVKKRVGLTATPIFNYGSEIFNVMNVLAPGCLGTFDQFVREWCTYLSDRKIIVNNPDALGMYLRDQNLMLRRSRADVNMELPPVNTIIHAVPYDEDEVDKAEDLCRQLAIKVVSGSFQERGQAAQDLDIHVRHMTGVAKAPGVAAYVRILLENNIPVVLGGWHRDVYDIWKKLLAEFNPVFYTGSESTPQKNKSKEAFINGDTNLFIMSLRSGAGIDGLQKRCSTVVYGELDYTPKIHDQFTGRINRDRHEGEQEQVMVIYLIAECGSDPGILDIMGLKSSQSHGIMNPLVGVQEQFTDESRIKKLAEKYLAGKHKLKTA